MTSKDLSDKLLDAILTLVPQYGWTDAALQHASDERHIPLADFKAAFPKGIDDALRAFSDRNKSEMLSRLGNYKLIQMRIRDRVMTAVWEWIQVVTPHRAAVAAAVRSVWNPMHASVGIR